MSSSKKSKAPTVPPLSDQGQSRQKKLDHSLFISNEPIEVQQTYSRFQSDLQNLASKIGELEQEAEEHVYVGNAFMSSICLLMQIRILG